MAVGVQNHLSKTLFAVPAAAAAGSAARSAVSHVPRQALAFPRCPRAAWPRLPRDLGTRFPGAVSRCVSCSFCCPRARSRNELVVYSRSVSFCAEHARRNALALQAQMKKSNPGPVSETLLCQLSSYARPELGAQSAESSRSEASRILGKDWKAKPVREDLELSILCGNITS